MAPKRVVYVSCDPATLARDVKILGEKGYQVDKVSVVDQFGHSVHVETVVKTTKETYLEILEFTHFVDFFSFNRLEENHKEKVLVKKVTVVVALDLGTGNTKKS